MNVQPIDTLIKKEDDTKTFQIRLLDDDNNIYEISPNETLEIDIELSKEEIIEKEVEVLDYENGIIKIDMQGIETGSYNCEIIVRGDDGTVRTFPTNGYFNVQINRNLERGE